VRCCPDGDFLTTFCVLYLQRAPCSTFETCILNSHKGHTMCASMVDIQSATAEIRRGKKKKKERRTNDRMKIYYVVSFMAALLHRAAIKYRPSLDKYVLFCRVWAVKQHSIIERACSFQPHSLFCYWSATCSHSSKNSLYKSLSTSIDFSLNQCIYSDWIALQWCRHRISSVFT